MRRFADFIKARTAIARARRTAAEPAPAMCDDYVLRIPRHIRLHQIADIASFIDCRIELAGDGRELRLTPRHSAPEVSKAPPLLPLTGQVANISTGGA